MLYLLDSNVWIEIRKAKNRQILDRFTRTPVSEMATCSPVRAELMHGAEKYETRDQRKATVTEALGKVVSLPFDDLCADQYAAIRHDLERRRCVIGSMDLQIAAIALAHGLTVITGNTEEFRRVHGLKVEDWSV